MHNKPEKPSIKRIAADLLVVLGAGLFCYFLIYEGTFFPGAFNYEEHGEVLSIQQGMMGQNETTFYSTGSDSSKELDLAMLKLDIRLQQNMLLTLSTFLITMLVAFLTNRRYKQQGSEKKYINLAIFLFYAVSIAVISFMYTEKTQEIMAEINRLTS
ncbi:hypothetical protein [Sinobaca sp. H24]|uniref:hypothetical protein n=1 Tax=Sinobaca sp. H24 TaxID=2923376 RepID=UPI00207B055B|nr:hypothetical protein [Sinobaca sp. H24]